MRVRASAPVRSYQPAICGFISGDTGTEWEGETAAFLASTGAPVEVIEADPAAPETTTPAAEPSTDDDAAVGPGLDPSFDPAEHTVEEVLDYVLHHPEQKPAVLAAEQAGKVRTTIVKALS